jgi:CRP-like cAMP-binding protein
MKLDVIKKVDSKEQLKNTLTPFFSKVELFAMLSKNERRLLSMYCYRRTFRAGEIIFKTGYPNVAFYIVKEGLLSVYLDENGQKIEIQKVKPLQYFGEIGLFLEDSRAANIEALEDSELIAISKKEFVKFIETKPRSGIKILYKMGEVLSSQILSLSREKVLKENLEDE